MNKLFVFLLLFLLYGLPSCTQTVTIEKIDSLLNALDKNDLAMGSLVISKDGAILFQQVIGNVIKEESKKIPADINTKYKIGSVSKLFTAVMLFQLVEEKKVNLNDFISPYFPSLPNADKITVGNLLNHRSGLHDYTKETGFDDWMDKPKTHEELLAIIANKGPDFAPDTKTEYNNSNYLVLSYLIERLCRMSYAEALKQRILDKIGLTHTGYGGPINPTRNESVSYAYFNNKWIREKETDMSIHSGAGSLVSTSGDLVKFIEALFAHKLVSPSSLQKMKNLREGFGYGLEPWMFQTTTGYGKGGKIEGFLSYVYYFPDQKIAVAYCTNGYIYPMNDIVEGVLRVLYKEPYSVPVFGGLASTSDDLDKYVGKYTAAAMPITVICKKTNTQLLLETKGQTFAVSSIGNHQFMNKQYGYFFMFIPERKQLLIKEKTNVYYLSKEK